MRRCKDVPWPKSGDQAVQCEMEFQELSVDVAKLLQRHFSSYS